MTASPASLPRFSWTVCLMIRAMVSLPCLFAGPADVPRGCRPARLEHVNPLLMSTSMARSMWFRT
jgi:hypothetical protein